MSRSLSCVFMSSSWVNVFLKIQTCKLNIVYVPCYSLMVLCFERIVLPVIYSLQCPCNMSMSPKGAQMHNSILLKVGGQSERNVFIVHLAPVHNGRVSPEAGGLCPAQNIHTDLLGKSKIIICSSAMQAGKIHLLKSQGKKASICTQHQKMRELPPTTDAG